MKRFFWISVVGMSFLSGFSGWSQLLVIEACSGQISPPFVTTNGAVFQPVTTGPTNGGRAVYDFVVNNPGQYVIRAVVTAPAEEANSFYVNIDGEPDDPAMICEVPVSGEGPTTNLVCWGPSTKPGQMPAARKVFSLKAGSHQLIVRGAEANARIERLLVTPLPSPPGRLRVVASP